jgi:hypothetical protein
MPKHVEDLYLLLNVFYEVRNVVNVLNKYLGCLAETTLWNIQQQLPILYCWSSFGDYSVVMSTVWRACTSVKYDKSSGMLRHVDFCIAMEVSKESGAFICSLYIKTTNYTFITNQIYVSLFYSLRIPTCFNFKKPSSGRRNHEGQQDVRMWHMLCAVFWDWVSLKMAFLNRNM